MSQIELVFIEKVNHVSFVKFKELQGHLFSTFSEYKSVFFSVDLDSLNLLQLSVGHVICWRLEKLESPHHLKTVLVAVNGHLMNATAF